MPFEDILTPERVIIDDSAQSKTAVLFKISQLLAQEHPELGADALFDAFWHRDSLGSTAIGHGIIIPHIRSAMVNKTYGCFILLEHPIDFGAEDKQPVDLVFGLIAPREHSDQHLQVLKNIIRQLNQAEFRDQCRSTKDGLALYNLLVSGTPTSPSKLESFEI